MMNDVSITVALAAAGITVLAAVYRGRTCNGTVSYVKAVSARSGRVPVGVVSVRSGSGAARV
jgi:hypothetical protein